MSIAPTLVVALLASFAGAQDLPPTGAATPTPHHFPSVGALVAQHGEPDLRDAEAREALERDLATANASWAALTSARHTLIGRVGDEKIARGDAAVLRGNALPPMAEGAVGRRIVMQDGEQVAADVFAADAADLALLGAELVSLHARVEQLVHGAFAVALPEAGQPGGGGGIPPVAQPCICSVTSRYVHQNDPPAGCIESWGITYAISAGRCDVGLCTSPKACEGSMQVLMDFGSGECGAKLGIESPPGQLEWTDTSTSTTLSYDVDVTLNCGQHVTLTWSVGGVTLGQTRLDCNDCAASGSGEE